MSDVEKELESQFEFDEKETGEEAEGMFDS